VIRRQETDRTMVPEWWVGMHRRPALLFTLGLWSAAAVLQAFAQETHSALVYNRNNLGAGELLGGLTGHLLHVGWSHYLLNMAGLGLILFLFKDAWTPARLMTVFIACLLAVDAGLWWLSPQVMSYAGLSGILHGLLGAGALFCWRTAGWFAALVLLATGTKLAWEQFVGATASMSEIVGAPIIVDSHLYGFIGGIIAAFFLRAAACAWRIHNHAANGRWNNLR